VEKPSSRKIGLYSPRSYSCSELSRTAHGEVSWQEKSYLTHLAGLTSSASFDSSENLEWNKFTETGGGTFVASPNSMCTMAFEPLNLRPNCVSCVAI